MTDDTNHMSDDMATKLGANLFFMNGLIVLLAGALHTLACRWAAHLPGDLDRALPWTALITLTLAALAGAISALMGRRCAMVLGRRLRQMAAAPAAHAEAAGPIHAQVVAQLGHDPRSPLNAIINFTRFLSKERYGTLTERQQDLQQRVLASAEELLARIDAGLADAARGALADPRAPLAPASTPAPAERVNPTIVVVDDDESSQEIFRDELESLGYTVVAVCDSRQALARIRQSPPQLVILDVLMPYLDGWEVLAQLKTMPDLSAIPVLICSVIEHQRLAITLGADDYLVKPIADAALITRVRRLIAPLATVLVIDDDPDARQIVRIALEESPYRLIEAANGQTCLTAVAAERPDLLILDLTIAGLDGFAALAQLRADPRHAELPILVLTARALSADESATLRDHNAHHLRKGPISAEALRDRLTQLIVAPDASRIDPPERD